MNDELGKGGGGGRKREQTRGLTGRLVLNALKTKWRYSWFNLPDPRPRSRCLKSAE